MLNRMPSVEKNLKQITKVNDREREIADTENKGRERKSVDVAARRSESESEREREREGERERLRSIAMYSLVLGESPRLPPLLTSSSDRSSRCTTGGGVSHLRALSLAPLSLLLPPPAAGPSSRPLVR